jgi:hypothetical protein
MERRATHAERAGGAFSTGMGIIKPQILTLCKVIIDEYKDRL